MWVLQNNTPFSAAGAFFRDRAGAEVWAGALRASFDVRADGRLERAERQTRPLRAALWWGEAGRSSLRDESDFQPKGGTDVLVEGDALLPHGRRASSIDVAWQLGNLSKTVRVYGERVWVRSSRSSAIVPGPAEPLERLPLRYEQAFGGTDPHAPAHLPQACAANPVGSGFCHQPVSLLGTPAPRLEHPGAPLKAAPEQCAPPGFGPIAAHWQPRLQLAGTYDATWAERRAPLLPHDFHEDFLRAAPHDQQLPRYLRGGEVFEVVHMTPEGAFRVRLPELVVRMTTVFSDGTERSEAPLQTVRLLPTERRLELCWLALSPCQGREHKLLRARLECTGETSCR